MRKVPDWKCARVTRVVLVRFAVMILTIPGAMQAASAQRLIAVPPPPMGWSSWNSFSNTVDAKIIMDQANAMVVNGMAKAGYQYVTIDEGWWLGQRDPGGNIVVDAKAWPAIAPGEQAGDMANIVRYIHSKGLRAGIYTDAGMDGCSLYPDLGPVYQHVGSEGHYEQDFLQFAKWGFDYVKVDWCGGDKEKLDPAVQYAEVARAIAKAEAATGHRLYYSICEWGNNSPWTWAPNVGGAPADIWRTSGDIVPPIVPHEKHSGRLASFPGVLSNFDQGIHPEAEHTGFYNDPDMMVVGMPGLTDAQSRVHMSLWAISAAPLLAGADLTTLSPATLATLTNPEVIAVDQDSLGLQGIKVATYGYGLEVWSKALSTPGERAVLLLNRTGDPAAITVHWGDFGLNDSSAVSVRDLWARKDLGSFDSSYSVAVQANDAAMLIVKGSEGKLNSYTATGADGVRGSREVTFTNVSSRVRVARLRISYINSGDAPQMAELRVNGQTATKIAFPSTGSDNSAGAIWIEALFDREAAKNVLNFELISAPGLKIESIAVE
ncbi:alpha-galactosidase [Telmatobacter sp. DSM 110680]|uniref:Alpha-galactosidase n=1 Tax=Telmatobacter sp. DSM 110680 TaxID=3036704 RepID=A0AAU7DL79_9BACT